MKKHCTLVTRSFQPQKNIVNFDILLFKKRFLQPLQKLTSKNQYLKEIIVLINGETDNQFAEAADDNGQFPTVFYLQQLTNLAINGIAIRPIVCKRWGLNVGSASALNMGLQNVSTDLVMFWSAEMDISGRQMNQAIDVMYQEKLNLLGFLRDDWFYHPSRCIPQNTAAIWKTKNLKKIDGFSEFCNGNHQTMITLEDGAQALLAGMEDFHALIQLSAIKKNFSWGMIGSNRPIKWNINQNKRNQLKIKRQETVMNKYIKLLKPKDSIQIYNRVFKKIQRYEFQ